MDFSKHSSGTTSVKVHNAPGGKSSFSLAWDEPEKPKPAQKPTQQAPPPQQQYQKPAGTPGFQQPAPTQAAGEKTSVKVHNPPGGKSSITFG